SQDFSEREAIDMAASGVDDESGVGRVSLANIKMITGSGAPVGSLDPATAFQGGLAVSGIAFDPDSVVPSQVSVVVDGGQVTSGGAGRPRPDPRARSAQAHNAGLQVPGGLASTPGVPQL